MVDEYVEKLCDELDAVVFSGDRLNYWKTLQRFKWYLRRWTREAEVFEKSFPEGDK